MSQGTFSDTLIPLEAFKRIFVLCPKIDLFPREISFFKGNKEIGFWFKMTKF